MEIDHAFSPINPTVGDVVKSLNSGFAVYTENGWSGSLTEIYGRHPFHYYSCKQTAVAFDFPDFTLPTVATAEVSDLGLEIGTAHGGGEVLSNGRTPVGLYWCQPGQQCRQPQHQPKKKGRHHGALLYP